MPRHGSRPHSPVSTLTLRLGVKLEAHGEGGAIRHPGRRARVCGRGAAAAEEVGRVVDLLPVLIHTHGGAVKIAAVGALPEGGIAGAGLRGGGGAWRRLVRVTWLAYGSACGSASGGASGGACGSACGSACGRRVWSGRQTERLLVQVCSTPRGTGALWYGMMGSGPQMRRRLDGTMHDRWGSVSMVPCMTDGGGAVARRQAWHLRQRRSAS